jgi:hypothetical protein
MPPVLEGNVYIRVVTVTALPPAADYPNVFAVHSGKLYWSDGVTWHQVAPPVGGAGASEDGLAIGILVDSLAGGASGSGGAGSSGNELVVGIITD